MRRIYGAIVLCIMISFGCASAPKFAVTSDPGGADIFVDGERVGKTPATIKVKFKENAQMVMEKKILTVKLPGYKEKREVICAGEDPIKSLNFTLVSEQVDKPASPTAANNPTAVTAPESSTGTGVASSAPSAEVGKSSSVAVSTAPAPAEQESMKSAPVENKAAAADQVVK